MSLKHIRNILGEYFFRFSSAKYWEKRYSIGGNSGPGSYGHLANFKALTLNKFVDENNITSVIEFGCGDGNQLTLANYLRYTGYDVSTVALEICKQKFNHDPSKFFFHISEHDNQKADLAISLDVIFHLTEDNIYEDYMHRLFSSALRFVVIYSSNQDESIKPESAHVRHRYFSAWIDNHYPQWKLLNIVANPYPYNGDSNTTSFSDFYIYQKS